MVRVLTIPVFEQQQVRKIDRPISRCCVSQMNKFLFTSDDSHLIEVSDLGSSVGEGSGEGVNFSFPTVDLVDTIIHCMFGNYIATVEMKTNQRGDRAVSKHVRIYANWDSVATVQQSKMTRNGVSLGQSECGMVQPMRARIAGRVTPSSGQATDTGNLEMIEIPMNSYPSHIACCQMSGNLLISSASRLYLFKCLLKTHETSRQIFLDFDDSGIYIDLTFPPKEISVCESFICASTQSQFIAFRLRSTVDYIPEHAAFQPTSMVNQNDCINFNDVQTTTVLPTISRQNSMYGHNVPFERDPIGIKARLVALTTTDATYGSRQMVAIEHLLQLKINSEITVDGVIHPLSEEFRCFTMRPYYLNEPYFCSLQKLDDGELEDSMRTPEMQVGSDFKTELITVGILLATSQEGYLFYFPNMDVDNTPKAPHASPVAIYNFTSPVVSVSLFETMLHTLTVAGLETYTVAPPSWIYDNRDPYYLIDLTQFIGVRKMFMCRNCLVLLACCERSPTNESPSKEFIPTFTLYNLALPDVLQVNTDMLRIAELHKQDSLQTYAELVHKGTVMLKTNFALQKFTTAPLAGGIPITVRSRPEFTQDQVNALGTDPAEEASDDNAPIADNTDTTYEEEDYDERMEVQTPFVEADPYEIVPILRAYRANCLILADYYIMQLTANEYEKSFDYYCIARTSYTTILRRFIAIPKTTNNPVVMQGLLFCLKKILLTMQDSTEADQYFTPSPEYGVYYQELLSQFKIPPVYHGTIIQLPPMEPMNISHPQPLYIPPNMLSTGNRTLFTAQELSGPQSLLMNETIQDSDDDVEYIPNDDGNVDDPNEDDVQYVPYQNVPDNDEAEPDDDDEAEANEDDEELEPDDDDDDVQIIEQAPISQRRDSVIVQRTDNSMDTFHLQTFGDAILEIFDKYQPNELASFVFRSSILREYATNRIISLFNNRRERLPLDNVALAVLFVQKNEEEAAANLIKHVPIIVMDSVLHMHWSLLFDTSSEYTTTSISDLTILLIQKHPNYTADLFLKLITRVGCLTLADFIEIFTSYMPSHISDTTANTNFVFKNVLQRNLDYYYARNPDLKIPMTDPALKYSLLLLARFYMSRMVISNRVAEPNDCVVTNNEVLMKSRFSYLDLISESYADKDANWDLMRMEGLLCSGVLPLAVHEYQKFLESYINPIASIRLESLLKPLQQVTELLVIHHPQCVLQFAKDRFTDDGQWQHLVAFMDDQLETEHVSLVCDQAMRQVLDHLARTVSVDRLLRMLPLTDEQRSSALHCAALDNNITCRDSTCSTCKAKIKSQRMVYKLITPDPDTDSESESEEVVEEENGAAGGANDGDGEEGTSRRRRGLSPFIEYIRLCKRTTHANQLRQFIVTTEPNVQQSFPLYINPASAYNMNMNMGAFDYYNSVNLRSLMQNTLYD